MIRVIHACFYAASAFMSVHHLLPHGDGFGSLVAISGFIWGLWAFPVMLKSNHSALFMILLSFPTIGAMVGLMLGIYAAGSSGSLDLGALAIFPLLGIWTAIVAPFQYPVSQGVIYVFVGIMSFAFVRLAATKD